MHIYLSGPMTGLPGYNYTEFDVAATFLRAKGHVVDNPAEHFGGDQGLPHAVYMRTDIAAILMVDAIAVLPGWRNSKGAVIEVLVGRAIGLPILDAITLRQIEVGCLCTIR